MKKHCALPPQDPVDTKAQATEVLIRFTHQQLAVQEEQAAKREKTDQEIKARIAARKAAQAVAQEQAILAATPADIQALIAERKPLLETVEDKTPEDFQTRIEKIVTFTSKILTEQHAHLGRESATLTKNHKKFKDAYPDCFEPLPALSKFKLPEAPPSPLTIDGVNAYMREAGHQHQLYVESYNAQIRLFNAAVVVVVNVLAPRESQDELTGKELAQTCAQVLERWTPYATEKADSYTHLRAQLQVKFPGVNLTEKGYPETLPTHTMTVNRVVTSLDQLKSQLEEPQAHPPEKLATGIFTLGVFLELSEAHRNTWDKLIKDIITNLTPDSTSARPHTAKARPSSEISPAEHQALREKLAATQAELAAAQAELATTNAELATLNSKAQTSKPSGVCAVQ